MAPPTAPTPSFQRPMFRMLKAILWPWPMSPSTLSTGIVQSSRKSGQVELPRMPSLCSSGPIVRPGALRSTKKPVNFSPSTLAKTVNRSAKPALVMYCFDAGELPALAVGRLAPPCVLARQRVRARARLGQRVGGDQLADGEARADTSRCCSAVPNSTSGIVPMPTCAPKLTANDPSRLAASVIRLELVLSPPRPPYASGTSWPSRPTSPAFSQQRAHHARLLRLDLGEARHRPRAS